MKRYAGPMIELSEDHNKDFNTIILKLKILLTSRTVVREVGKGIKMEAGRSFAKMFGGQKDKNWLDNLSVGNGKDQNKDDHMTEQNIRLVKNEDLKTEVNKNGSSDIQSGNVMDQIKELNQELISIRQNRDEVIKKYEDSQNRIVELQAKITELEINKSALTNNDAALQSLKIQFDQKVSELQAIQEIRSDEIKKMAETNNLIQQLEIENQSLLNKLTVLDNEKTELLKTNELKIHELEERLNAKSVELENLQVVIDSSENDIIDDDVIVVDSEEITTAMAENGRLAMLNHELETKLIESENAKVNAELLYQELRSLMVAIGVEHNLEVFDQQKIELAEKSKIIIKLDKLLSERDNYITKIQDSLMSGIGQMFQQRPTGLLESADEPEQQDQNTTSDNDLSVENNDSLNVENDQDKNEEYYKHIDNNWTDIKNEAQQYLNEGNTLEEVAETLELKIEDLEVIINSKKKYMSKIRKNQ